MSGGRLCTVTSDIFSYGNTVYAGGRGLIDADWYNMVKSPHIHCDVGVAPDSTERLLLQHTQKLHLCLERSIAEHLACLRRAVASYK